MSDTFNHEADAMDSRLIEEEKGEKAMYEFYVAGVKFHHLKEVINEVEVGQYLTMTPEPTNQYDHNAVRLEYFSTDKDGLIMIGYVPAKISAEVTADLVINSMSCQVIELNKEESPWKQIKVKIEES